MDYGQFFIRSVFLFPNEHFFLPLRVEKKKTKI